MDQHMSWSLAFCVSLKPGNKEISTTKWRHFLHCLLREMFWAVTKTSLARFSLTTAARMSNGAWNARDSSRNVFQHQDAIRDRYENNKTNTRILCGRITGFAKRNIRAGTIWKKEGSVQMQKKHKKKIREAHEKGKNAEYCERASHTAQGENIEENMWQRAKA